MDRIVINEDLLNKLEAKARLAKQEDDAVICPDVVLALISELRRRAKMNWMLAGKLATSEYSCVDPVQLSVELSAARRAAEQEMELTTQRKTR